MSFVSPAQGRVTSEWGPRERHPVTGEAGFHRGIDIAPPIRGQRGVPVFACYPGTVVYVSEGVYDKLRRRWTYNEDITGGWNSGSLVVIAGDGGGNEAYGHMSGIKVRVGQRVKAGDLLGVMDEIGNVSGIHLHLEMWNGRTQGGGLKGGNTRNPRIDFKAHGVTPGSAPVLPKQGGDALTPDKNTPTPLPEDWFTMATEAQLRSIVREELQHKLQDDVVKIKHAVGRIDPGATGDTALAEPIARAVAQYTEGDTGMTLWARIARILDRSELTNHAVGRIDRTIPGIAKNVGAPLDTDQLARAVVDQITGELDQVITKAVTAAVADIPARDLEQILDAARADLKTRLEN